jgi:lipopolysaccharide export system protein LptA
MPLKVYRLRRLLAVTAIVLTLVVAGMYFYARSKAMNALKTIPGKIGYDIKQTANGFQFSKSNGNRTLFTVQASDVKQFKINGNAELHNVNIVLYGRDSSRYDQIYGDDFAYDQKTGDVIARGDVQIDLVANPTGEASPDQSTPKEVKNPIHLKTRNLVFNRDTGNAATDERVEFRTPQASGSAVGVTYAGKSNTLTLASQIHIVLSGTQQAVLEAEHGTITNDPRQIILDHARLVRSDGTVRADHATFYLSSDNHVQRVLAVGDVNTVARPGAAKGATARNGSADQQQEIHGRSEQAEFLLLDGEDLLHTAILTGNVHIEQTGTEPVQGEAGRVVVDFAGQNEVEKIHALDGAHLLQKATNASGADGKTDGSGKQDFDLTAPAIDFALNEGRMLKHAATVGAAEITITDAQPGSAAANRSGQKTVVTADKFDADFVTTDGHTRLSTVLGTPHARIVNSKAGQPDRVSTSDSVLAVFLPQGGIDSITQKGSVAYSDSETPDKRMQGWGDSGRYTPSDQMLVLTGSPRVANGGMQTTANTIKINRATRESTAEGDVKTSYSELKEQPDGALLASSSPIHVTARTMTAHGNAGVALYEGKARLWQDANVIEAPSIEFDRDRRFVTAQGTAAHPVHTVLTQTEKDGPQKSHEPGKKGRTSGEGEQTGPIAITALTMTYADSERKVHYEGGVLAKGADFSATSETADAYLMPRSQSSINSSAAGPGQLDHMVAEGSVRVQQPNRRAEGEKLVYTAADDKFVLTGGSPSIFDAEQGKITGVSLTFFRRDDRVLVEGEASTAVVRQRRVAR